MFSTSNSTSPKRRSRSRTSEAAQKAPAKSNTSTRAFIQWR